MAHCKIWKIFVRAAHFYQTRPNQVKIQPISCQSNEKFSVNKVCCICLVSPHGHFIF